MSELPVLLIGLSDPASAGKITLAHLLSNVFSPHIVCILRGDDFCKEFNQIPIVNGYLDADGPHGVDFKKIGPILDYLKANHGWTPIGFRSWQAEVFPGQHSRALELVSEDVLQELRKKVNECGVLQRKESPAKMAIVEVFMLYNVPRIRERLECRLFVRLSHKQAKHRRMTRPNYGAEAEEGESWKTEEYFEKMVWRNYVEQHKDSFVGGDVEEKVSETRCIELGIVMQDGMDVGVGCGCYFGSIDGEGLEAEIDRLNHDALSYKINAIIMDLL
jgi:uridine kinase